MKSTTKSKLIKFRAFLKENEIYLNLSNAVITLVLTFLSVRFSFFALEVAKNQANLENMLSQPVVNAEITKSTNGSIESITFTNEGYPIHDYYFEYAPFYFVVVSGPEYNLTQESRSYCLPINDVSYPICAIETTYSKTGLLATVSLTEDAQAYIDDVLPASDPFILTTESESSLCDYSISYISLNYCIKLYYTDLLGNDQVETYSCHTDYKQKFTDSKFRSTYDVKLISSRDPEINIYNDLFSPDIVKYTPINPTQSLFVDSLISSIETDNIRFK